MEPESLKDFYFYGWLNAMYSKLYDDALYIRRFVYLLIN